MRYIDAGALIQKMFPLGIGDGKYTINAKAAKFAIDNAPTADVAPRSSDGAECPICHGTGRIGTTDWLIRGLSEKQLAEKKARAIAEHEQHIKTEIAREIFEEIEKIRLKEIHKCETLREREGEASERKYWEGGGNSLRQLTYWIANLKKKYTEGE